MDEFNNDNPMSVQNLLENEKLLKLFSSLLKEADKERRQPHVLDSDRQERFEEEFNENLPGSSTTTPPAVFLKPSNNADMKKPILRKQTTSVGLPVDKLTARRLREKIREFQKVLISLNTCLKISLETFALYDDEPPLTFIIRSNAAKNVSFFNPNISRDAHLLFTVKRVVNNLKQETKLVLNYVDKFCIAGRALCRLLNCFTLRLNNLDAVALPHIFAFAISISELCRRFLEYVAQQQQQLSYAASADTIKEFENFVDTFQLEIVLGLREKRDVLFSILQQKVEQLLSVKKSTGIRGPRKKLTYYRPDFRPKGYLLPLKLQKTSPEIPLQPDDKASFGNKKILIIPKYTITKVEAYAEKTKARQKLNRELYGLPVGTSTAAFTENLAQEILEETVVEFEQELSTLCEEIVDEIYDLETN